MEKTRFAQTVYRMLAALPPVAILLLSACGGASGVVASSGSTHEGGVSLSAGFDSASVRMPVASGAYVKSGNGVTLDASNAAEGYVMVASEPNEKTMITRVAAAAGTYNYRQRADNTFETYPLQMGSGAYDVQGFEQVEGDRYARVFTEALDVTLRDERAPFLYPNQYVSYAADDAAVAASFAIAEGLSDPAEIADKLYRYVADGIEYDEEKARTVQDGYLPVPDETLASKKGICFDYAALLATMLRVQGIPARLVIGHVAPDNVYHAWNQAYIGGKWVHFDPTLARERRSENNYQAERIY